MPSVAIPERLAILKGNEGWFGRAPQAFQDAVLGRCAWVTCPAGRPIYQTTDTNVNFCGIVDGAVQV